MAEEKREAERLGGEYMIQDCDHASETGQLGGHARLGTRQSEQSQGDNRQDGGGQQGAERGYRRRKYL